MYDFLARATNDKAFGEIDDFLIEKRSVAKFIFCYLVAETKTKSNEKHMSTD